MRKVVILVLLTLLLGSTASAAEYTAPPPPSSVQDLMPVETESFSKGLLEILQNAIADIYPSILDGSKICIALIATTMIVSILRQFPSGSADVVSFAGVLMVSVILLSSTKSMVALGVDTVNQLAEYGKLLLPVMTAALAAQGGVTSSGALYTGTAAFNALLSGLITRLLVPLIYMFLVLAIAGAVTHVNMVQKLRDFIKWLVSWGLKVILYIFTGYMGITGVISGSTDAAALKAAKLTISGVIPMVGGILSDASEAVVVSAGIMKNAVGIYGLLVIAVLWIHPFLQLGIQYLLLKATAAICAIFDIKAMTGIIEQFSTAMGLLMGMTGSVCFLLLISTVCFMRGVG